MTTVTPAAEIQPPNFTDKIIDSETFAGAVYSHSWLVTNVLVQDQPCIIGGPKKVLKTTLAVDLAVSLRTGQPFLQLFPVPKAVNAIVLSGESGLATLQETAKRVCQEKGKALGDCKGLSWGPELPCLAATRT